MSELGTPELGISEAGMPEVVRLAMWSGPRNLSTAMMRSWENRPDTVVMDEPLYAHYLAATGLDHPMGAEILRSQPTDGDDAIARCLAPLPAGIRVSYQKHMSHHLLPDLDRTWLDQLRHVLLLRHPARVLASYLDKRGDVVLEDLGLPQQLELLDRAELVIDSDDFLLDPQRHLEAICDLIGVGFDDAMLRWPAGRRSSDGVWASHWYDAVWQSTGFATGTTRPLPPAPPGYERLLAEAVEIYDELAARRLVLT